jgi:hypothetical protein
VLQDWSLLEIEFFGKTYIISWLLMTISKDQSTHSESSILQVSSMLKISMNNGHDYHDAGKDGYQNTDSPCDQLGYNVGTYHYDSQLEQVKLKLLEGIQHFGTGLVWNNWEYER